MRVPLTLTCSSVCCKCEGSGLVFTNDPCGSSERLPNLCPCVRSVPAKEEPLELETPAGKPTVVKVPPGFVQQIFIRIQPGDHVLVPEKDIIAEVLACREHLGEYYLYDTESRCIARSHQNPRLWVKRE